MSDQIASILQNHLANSSAPAPAGWQSAEQTVVARQPVFDNNGCLWGYELLYRRPEKIPAGDVTGSVATASVIVNGYGVVRPGMRNGQKLLINFTSDLLEAQVLKLMPPEICVAEILEEVEPTPQILDAVAALKGAGYQVALDDYIGQETLLPFLPLADIVKIDVLGLSPEDVTRLVLHARSYPCRLLAEKVENSEMAELCRRLGFSLFQGFFFSRPEVMRGKKFSASHAARTRLMALCAQPDVDLRKITEAVMHDAVITSRFLRFANSAYFGFAAEVCSVHHALLLVGRITFMQWLCVNVLASMEAGPVCRDMAFLAAQRAKFLETLGATLARRGTLPQGVLSHDLFLAGLFSLLASLLGLSVDEVLEDIPLGEGVLEALKGEESAYSPWLRLMELYEQGRWEESSAIAGGFGLTDADLSATYADAVSWSASFFSMT